MAKSSDTIRFVSFGAGFNMGQKIARESSKFYQEMTFLEFMNEVIARRDIPLDERALLCYGIGVLHGYYATGGVLRGDYSDPSRYGYEESLQIGRY